jgi:hypothetical protein
MRHNNTHKNIEFNDNEPKWQRQHQSNSPTTASNTNNNVNNKVGCRSTVGSCVVMVKSDRRMFWTVAT